VAKVWPDLPGRESVCRQLCRIFAVPDQSSPSCRSTIELPVFLLPNQVLKTRKYCNSVVARAPDKGQFVKPRIDEASFLAQWLKGKF
jgi:hypothetical protein